MERIIDKILYIYRLSLIGGYTKKFADKRIDRVLKDKIYRDSIEIRRK